MTIPGQASSNSTRAPVQAFWLGPLSTMERLAIASFVANGHPFHLYTYEELDGVPEGAVIKDGREVLPYSWRFRDSHGTFSGFANAFRYKLLFERGGWWIDMDMVCLAPLEFADEYVFGLEPDLTVGSSIILVPPGSDLMRYAWERSRALRPWWRRLIRRRQPWGTTGPALFGEAVEACGLSDRALEPAVFYPIDYPEWEEVLKPGVTLPDSDTKAIHLWNLLWDLNGRDKDATYPHDCLYEQLKRRYLGNG
jgi:hypothetical protein